MEAYEIGRLNQLRSMKKQKESIAVSLNNALLGTSPKLNKKQKRIVRKNPYGDYDDDKIINALDCSPTNPKQHGIISTIKSWFAPKPAPTPKPPGGFVVKPTPTPPFGGFLPAPPTPFTPSPITPAPPIGGGGSYNPSTQTYTSPEGYQQSMSEEAAKQIGAKTITKAEQEKQKLTPGISIVTAYAPPTKKEIETAKQLETKEKLVGAYQKIKGVFERLTPPTVDIVPKYGEGYGMRRAPLVIDVTGTLPFEQRGTKVERPTTIEELEKLKYYEEVAKRKLQDITVSEKFKLDGISQKEAEKISNELISESQLIINNKFNELQTKVNEGKLEVDDAQKQLDNTINKQNKYVETQFEDRHTKVLTPYVQESTEKTKAEAEKISKFMTKAIDKRDYLPMYASMFLTGSIYGTIGTIAPPIGLAAGGLFIGKAATSIPEIKEYAKERPLTFGAGIAGAIIGGLVGGYATAKLYPKATGYVRTIGRKEIPIEKLTFEEVIVGKKTFPTAGEGLTIAQRAKLHKAIFEKAPYKLPRVKEPLGYHAMPEKLTGLEVLPSKSELPGLYIAPGVSPHFLKVGARYTAFKWTLESPFGKPGIAAVVPKGFKIGKIAKPGYAYVPGIKTEIEAIIAPGTKLIPAGKVYYTTWGGVRIPIDQFLVGAGKVVKVPKITAAEISTSYRLPSTYPYYTPGSFGAIISGVSYKPSYEKPYQVSYQISSAKLSKAVSDMFSVKQLSYIKKKYVAPTPAISYDAAYVKNIEKSFGYVVPEKKVPYLTIIKPPKLRKEYKKERMKEKTKVERQLERQRRAYQASLGAAVLGYKVSKKQLARLSKQQFTGLELRPVIENDLYSQPRRKKNQSQEMINKLNKVLIT